MTVMFPAPVNVPPPPTMRVSICDSSAMLSDPKTRSSAPSPETAETVVAPPDEYTTVTPAGMQATSEGPGRVSGFQLAASCHEVVAAPPSQSTLQSPAAPAPRITSPLGTS